MKTEQQLINERILIELNRAKERIDRAINHLNSGDKVSAWGQTDDAHTSIEMARNMTWDAIGEKE